MVYFSMAYVVYKHQALYVYVNEYESGGTFLPQLLTRTILCVVVSQVLLFFFFLVNGNYYGGFFLAPLPFVTSYFNVYLKSVYAPLVTNLPYDIAIHIDQTHKFREYDITQVSTLLQPLFQPQPQPQP